MNLHAFRQLSARRSEGFTFVELLVVLLIVGILAAMAAMITRAITAGQKRSLTATRLAAVDSALVQFVILQKRLPCPADGRKTAVSDPSTVGSEERDVAGVCTSVQHGVAPWKTLGLAEPDATDGWDRRLTYRVQAALAADNGMDMSMCDPASQNPPNNPATPVAVCNTACTSAALLNTTSCTPPRSFLVNKGLEVRTTDGVTKIMDPAAALPAAPTGAAYVLSSHGESGGGAYLNSGVISTSTVTDGTEEQKNYASAVLQPYYVDDSISDAGGVLHFDDIVSRPSVLSVINKAGLGPRPHL
jgi:prepilin-type N-terminal cleavage/methylation domain-containing protein